MKINRNIDKKKSKFKIILTTFCCLLGLSTFCNATTIEELIELNCATYLQEENLCGRNSFESGTGYYFQRTITNQQPNYVELFDYSTFIPYSGAGTYCINIIRNGGGNAQQLTMGFANGPTTTPTNLYSLYADQYGKRVCLYGNKPHLNVKGSTNTETRIIAKVFKLENFLEKTLSGYILESSINQAYCTGHNLCPTCEQCEQCPSCPIIDQEYCEANFNLISPSNCPVCSGGVSNRSALWINNIQHLGASNIYMSIPEEISRDYSYSNSGEIMEIDVEGYNVDYDYINGVVNVQKYKPSSEDFTQVVGILAPYMKIFLFLLFLFIVIKRLKKPFKSRLK